MTMRTRTPTVRFLSAALGLLLVPLGACGTAAPAAPGATPAALASPAAPKPVAVAESEPHFTSVETARAALVGSLATVAPIRIVGDLDTLSQRLRLPMLLGHELLSALGGMGIAGDSAQFQRLLDRVDPESPTAVVWVLPPSAQAKGYCAAVTFRDSAGARATLDEMGTPGQRSGGIEERRSAGGDKIWGGIKGRTLFVSGSAETLLFAGGLAEAEQVPPIKGQMALTVLPRKLATASGQTPDALVAHVASLVAGTAQTGQGKTTPALQRMVVAMVEVVTKMVLDSTAVHLYFEAGPNDGVLLQAEFVPASGTELATRTARRTPYAFDTRLPVKSDGTAVFAIGDWGSWMAMAGKMFESTGKAGHAMWRDTNKVMSMTGGWSCVVDPSDSGLSTLCSSALKSGARGKAALDAEVAMLTSQNAWEAELDGRKASPLKVKRGRDMVEIEKKIENKEPTAQAVARAMAGGDTIKYALSVKDGWLLMATGRDARKPLSGYGTARSMAAAPLLAATLARTKGDEAMASVDVVSLALRVLAGTKDLPGNQMARMAGAMPGVAEMTAPFTFALRGGNSLQGDFRIPLGSLENIAKVVRGMVGPASAPSSP